MKKVIKCEYGIIKELTLTETVEEFRKIIYSKDIFKWQSYYEKDDLIQMAYMGLIKAYDYYDISENMSFASFSKKVVQDSITNTYKKDKRQKRGGDTELCSIYSIVDESDNLQMIETIEDENCNCEASALNNITNKILQDTLKTLSKEEQELVNLHFIKDLNCAEIGRLYNKTRECIRYRLKQVTKKLQSKLLNEVMA